MNHLNQNRWWLSLFLFFAVSLSLQSWGFFSHKLINQQAVYLLPLELQRHFLPHQDYLATHAVDPDKRRYAIKAEAPQHFFDTELWEKYIDPKEIHHRKELLWSLPSLMLVNQEDTSYVEPADSIYGRLIENVGLFDTNSEWNTEYGMVVDTMVQHGILPLTITKWYYKLVRAFENQDLELALKVAADLGHYIGDAHVPLHTTKNYNGQLTNQIGIHAFWETHVPELMAETDFTLVGQTAVLVDQPLRAAWEMVQRSHTMVDSVLSIEKEVRQLWPDDEEDCARDRTNNVSYLPCPDLLRAYDKALDGMIERQMVRTIEMVASFWWTAYVNAGQPILNQIHIKPVTSSTVGNPSGTLCE